MARHWAVVFCLALLMGMAAPAQAQADVTRWEATFPLNTTLESCDGETLQITGTQTIVGHAVVNDAGMYHTNVHWTWDGTAVGLDTGAVYEVARTSSSVTNGEDPATSPIATWMELVRIGTGRDRIFTKTLIHRVLEFDPFELKVFFVKEMVVCNPALSPPLSPPRGPRQGAVAGWLTGRSGPLSTAVLVVALFATAVVGFTRLVDRQLRRSQESLT